MWLVYSSSTSFFLATDDDIGYRGKNKIEAAIRTAWKDGLAVRLGIGLGQMQ